MKTIFFGILLIGSVYTGYGMGNIEKEIVFRPVTLTVFDADTKAPLEGIVVTISNRIAYTKAQRFLWFPIDSVSEYTFHGYRYETNVYGSVEIPEFKYFAKRSEYLYSQNIYINFEAVDKDENIEDQVITLDIMSSLYTPRYTMLYRPQSIYKAAAILSRPEPMDFSYQLERTKPYITFYFNGHTRTNIRRMPRDFNIDHEDFRIYLERFVEPEVGEY